MSDSNRYGNLTLVIAAIAALLGILAVGYALVLETYSERRELHAEYQERAEEYQREAQQRVADACIGISGAPFTECIVNQIAAYEANKPADEDLRAQQDMALWALWMFIAAGATVLVTAVGIYYVRETLDATRATVLETRRIGEAQVRAYLAVEKVDAKHKAVDEGRYQIVFGDFTIGWKNFGQSPARNVAIWSAIRTVPIEECDQPIADWVDIESSAQIGFTSIAVNDIRWSGHDVPGDDSKWMPADTVDEWIDNKIAVLIYSYAKYRDVFGRNHFAESCQRAIHFTKDDGNGIIRYADYPHHNSDD